MKISAGLCLVQGTRADLCVRGCDALGKQRVFTFSVAFGCPCWWLSYLVGCPVIGMVILFAPLTES